MANVVVTGGAGFIGSHLVERLLAKKHSVSVIDNLSLGKRSAIPKSAVFYQEDIRNNPLMAKIFSSAEFVFHLAALPRIQRSVINPLETSDVNIQGTVSVLEAARINKVKRVIFASSSSVYGEQAHYPLTEDMLPAPLSPYALQKYVGERYCRLYNNLYGLQTVCLRYFSVYGENQNGEEEYATVIGKFLYMKRENKQLPIYGDGKNERDFTYVDDVVAATLSAMETKKLGKGDIINVCSGKKYSVNEVATMIGGRKAYLDERPGESRLIWGDNSKARKTLSWKPEAALYTYLTKKK